MFGRRKPKDELNLRLLYDDGKVLEINARLSYEVRKSLTLKMSSPTQLELKAPLHMLKSEIQAFVLSKKDWIGRRALALEKEVSQRESVDAEEIEFWKKLTQKRAEAFLAAYDGLKPKKLSVRRQKSRWGSYSSSGVLSLNLNAARLDDALFEYLMIHELMHLYEMNHSSRFWELVEARIPDYRERRSRLKKLPLL